MSNNKLAGVPVQWYEYSPLHVLRRRDYPSSGEVLVMIFRAHTPPTHRGAPVCTRLWSRLATNQQIFQYRSQTPVAAERRKAHQPYAAS